MYAIRRCANFKQLAKFERSRVANIGQSPLVNGVQRTFYTYSPEPSQPINRDPTFCSIEEAVKCVKSGKYIAENTWEFWQNFIRNSEFASVIAQLVEVMKFVLVILVAKNYRRRKQAPGKSVPNRLVLFLYVNGVVCSYCFTAVSHSVPYFLDDYSLECILTGFQYWFFASVVNAQEISRCFIITCRANEMDAARSAFNAPQ